MKSFYGTWAGIILVFLTFMPLIVFGIQGCAARNAFNSPYNAAVVVFQELDEFEAARIDKVETSEELICEQKHVDRLIAVRDALVLLKRELESDCASCALMRARLVLDSLELTVSTLQAEGVAIPPSITQGLKTLDEVVP